VIGQLFADDRAFMADVIGRTSMFYGSAGRAMEMDMANFVLLGELLGQGQATGEINPADDPLQLAEILTATYMLTITNWLSGWWGEVGALDSRLMSAVGVFLQGCTTRPAP
jgi:hypothetical protein